jgi:glycosyltransferase involved in cell wall biosynthesis
MRVLLDCRMATWTGIGRYTTGLARSLARRDDIELVQLVARGQLAPVPDLAEVIAVAGSPLSPLAARGFSRVAREVGSDVIHCAHFPTPIPTVHPLVVTLHDLTPMVLPEVMPSRIKRAVWTWWNRRAAREADLIAANSQHTASDIRRLLPDSDGKVRVVLHATDDALVREPAEALPGDLAAWLGATPFVLSMGNTKPNKDLPTLLAAFQTLAVC